MILMLLFLPATQIFFGFHSEKVRCELTNGEVNSRHLELILNIGLKSLS